MCRLKILKEALEILDTHGRDGKIALKNKIREMEAAEQGRGEVKLTFTCIHNFDGYDEDSDFTDLEKLVKDYIECVGEDEVIHESHNLTLVSVEVL